MIAIRRFPRAEWERKLHFYQCGPLDDPNLPELETAEFWLTSWGYKFTVPVDSDDCIDQWALQKLIADIVKTAPPDTIFEAE